MTDDAGRSGVFKGGMDADVHAGRAVAIKVLQRVKRDDAKPLGRAMRPREIVLAAPRADPCWRRGSKTGPRS